MSFKTKTFKRLAVNILLGAGITFGCKAPELVAPETLTPSPENKVSHSVPRPRADPNLIAEATAFFTSPLCDSLVKVGFENFKKPLTEYNPMGKLVDSNPQYPNIFKDFPDAIVPHKDAVILDIKKLAVILKEQHVTNCQYPYGADTTKFMTLEAKRIINLAEQIEKLKVTEEEKKTPIYVVPNNFGAGTGRAKPVFKDTEDPDAVIIIAGAFLALGHLSEEHVLDVLAHEQGHIYQIKRLITLDGQLNTDAWLPAFEVQADSSMNAKRLPKTKSSTLFSVFSKNLTPTNYKDLKDKPANNFKEAAKLLYNDEDTHPAYHMRSIYQEMFQKCSAEEFAKNIKFFNKSPSNLRTISDFSTLNNCLKDPFKQIPKK